MLKLYVLMMQLSKQQRFPGETHKSRTDKSFLGIMEVQGPRKASWGRVGSLSVRWGSGASRQITCEGEMEMSLHPDLQPCVWNFEGIIPKWKVFAKMESWMPFINRLSSLPPPCSALCAHSFRFACLFICWEVLFVLFPSFLFPIFLVLLLQVLILETFRHSMSVSKIFELETEATLLKTVSETKSSPDLNQSVRNAIFHYI